MTSMRTKEERVCNLGQFLTPANSCDRPAAGKWGALPYESEVGNGTLIFCSNGQPEVSSVHIPLNVSGEYTIFLGIYSGHTPSSFWAFSPQWGGKGGQVLLRAKLTQDPVFDTLSDEHYGPKSGLVKEKNVDPLHDILEVRWKTAHVHGGEKLIVANLPHEAFAGTLAVLAYVRLVPAESEDKASCRRSIALFDSSFWGGWPRNKGELQELLEPFRDSDFRVMCWETVKGENCYYPTEIGRVLPPCENSWFYPNYIPRDLRQLMAQADPLELIPRCVHDLGLEFYASLRFMGTRFPFSFFTWPGDGGFFFENRQFWTRDETGSAMPHFSLAYSPVRQLFLDLFQEQLTRYDLDGVNILYNRSYPFVLFEEPVIQSFQKQYGQDPRILDRMDERLWRHRAGYVTEFMRDLRSLVDTVGSRRGKRLGVSAVVMNSPRQSLYFGLDVEAWIRQGLVDRLIIHPCFSAEAFDGTWITPENVAQYRCLAEGFAVDICPDLYPRHLPPETMIPRILDYYGAGAAGISFWDTYSRFWRKSEWSILRRAGNRELLERWATRPPVFWRKVEMKSFAGVSLDRRYGAQTHG